MQRRITAAIDTGAPVGIESGWSIPPIQERAR
jgi:hypothetical protein